MKKRKVRLHIPKYPHGGEHNYDVPGNSWSNSNVGEYYKYPGRPGAKYIKDVHGNWLINLGKSTQNNYVTIGDPTGRRANMLEARAVKVNDYDAFLDRSQPNVSESTSVVNPNTNIKIKSLTEEYNYNYQQKKFEESKEYFRGWHKSPMYKKMIERSAPNTHEYYTEGRKANLEDIGLRVEDLQPKDKPVTGAYSSTNTGNITILPLGNNVAGLLRHEESHSTDRPYYRNSNFNDWFTNKPIGRLIPQSDIKLIQRYTPGSFLKSPKAQRPIYKNNLVGKDGIRQAEDFMKYVAEPTETRARLHDIRGAAKEAGIYDPFTQKVTKDILKKLLKHNFEIPSNKGFSPMSQLRGVYTEEQIIHLLNTVSDIGDDNNQELTQAKYGGLFQYHNGGVGPGHPHPREQAIVDSEGNLKNRYTQVPFENYQQTGEQSSLRQLPGAYASNEAKSQEEFIRQELNKTGTVAKPYTLEFGEAVAYGKPESKAKQKSLTKKSDDIFKSLYKHGQHKQVGLPASNSIQDLEKWNKKAGKQLKAADKDHADMMGKVGKIQKKLGYDNPYDVLTAKGFQDFKQLYKDKKITYSEFNEGYENILKPYDWNVSKMSEEDQAIARKQWYGEADEDGRRNWMSDPRNVAKVAAVVAVAAPLAPFAPAVLANPVVQAGLTAYGGYDAVTNSIPLAYKDFKAGRYKEGLINTGVAALDLAPIPAFGKGLLGNVKSLSRKPVRIEFEAGRRVASSDEIMRNVGILRNDVRFTDDFLRASSDDQSEMLRLQGLNDRRAVRESDEYSNVGNFVDRNLMLTRLAEQRKMALVSFDVRKTDSFKNATPELQQRMLNNTESSINQATQQILDADALRRGQRARTGGGATVQSLRDSNPRDGIGKSFIKSIKKEATKLDRKLGSLIESMDKSPEKFSIKDFEDRINEKLKDGLGINKSGLNTQVAVRADGKLIPKLKKVDYFKRFPHKIPKKVFPYSDKSDAQGTIEELLENPQMFGFNGLEDLNKTIDIGELSVNPIKTVVRPLSRRILNPSASKFGKFEGPGLRKEGDFPFQNLDSDVFKELKGTGLSAEINQAIKKSLQEKGFDLYSGGTGHTKDGATRYAKELLNNRVTVPSKKHAEKLDKITSKLESLMKSGKSQPPHLADDAFSEKQKMVEELIIEIGKQDAIFKYKEHGGTFSQYFNGGIHKKRRVRISMPPH